MKMEVDEALGKLGTIGRWQVLYYTMISTACMVPACFHTLAIVFIGKAYKLRLLSRSRLSENVMTTGKLLRCRIK